MSSSLIKVELQVLYCKMSVHTEPDLKWQLIEGQNINGHAEGPNVSSPSRVVLSSCCLLPFGLLLETFRSKKLISSPMFQHNIFLRVEHLCRSKISQLHFIVFGQKNILWLQVKVHYLFTMQFSDRLNKLLAIVSDLRLGKLLRPWSSWGELALLMGHNLTFFRQLHYQVNLVVLRVVDNFYQVYDVPVSQLLVDVNLTHTV